MMKGHGRSGEGADRELPESRLNLARSNGFYSRLVDELLNADILPWLTLYHWDLPQAVQESGGLAEMVQDGDLAVIAAPIDFLGVNHYHDDSVSGHPLPADAEPDLAPTERPTRSRFVGSEYVTFPTRHLPRTAMGWEVNPPGLRRLLVRLGREYDNLPPLYVTENGAAYADVVSDDGDVHDVGRTGYIVDHIGAVRDAIADGADIRGYFVWSLLDNFEWAWGYDMRFGVVRVDYESQVRTIKDSGREYARIIHGAST